MSNNKFHKILSDTITLPLLPASNFKETNTGYYAVLEKNYIPITSDIICIYKPDWITGYKFIKEGENENETKEGIFTGLNNYSVNSVLSDDDDLSAAFGFTPDEVQSMFSYYGISDLYGQAKSFYDGYRIGSKEIFCPWDVTRYASDLLKPRVNGPASFDPPAYWNNTSNVRISPAP